MRGALIWMLYAFFDESGEHDTTGGPFKADSIWAIKIEMRRRNAGEQLCHDFCVRYFITFVSDT
jgi:hypothetical protein